MPHGAWNNPWAILTHPHPCPSPKGRVVTVAAEAALAQILHPSVPREFFGHPHRLRSNARLRLTLAVYRPLSSDLATQFRLRGGPVAGGVAALVGAAAILVNLIGPHRDLLAGGADRGDTGRSTTVVCSMLATKGLVVEVTVFLAIVISLPHGR